MWTIELCLPLDLSQSSLLPSSHCSHFWISEWGFGGRGESHGTLRIKIAEVENWIFATQKNVNRMKNLGIFLTSGNSILHNRGLYNRTDWVQKNINLNSRFLYPFRFNYNVPMVRLLPWHCQSSASWWDLNSPIATPSWRYDHDLLLQESSLAANPSGGLPS